MTNDMNEKPQPQPSNVESVIGCAVILGIVGLSCWAWSQPKATPLPKHGEFSLENAPRFEKNDHLFRPSKSDIALIAFQVTNWVAVSRVSDGDTITVIRNGQSEKIRLNG